MIRQTRGNSAEADTLSTRGKNSAEASSLPEQSEVKVGFKVVDTSKSNADDQKHAPEYTPAERKFELNVPETVRSTIPPEQWKPPWKTKNN